MSKRRKGYPSETNVKRGDRTVHGTKELLEKLGRNDLCPCGNARSFSRSAVSAQASMTVHVATTIAATDYFDAITLQSSMSNPPGRSGQGSQAGGASTTRSRPVLLASYRAPSARSMR